MVHIVMTFFLGIGVVNIHDDDGSSHSMHSLELNTNSNSSYPGDSISVDYNQLKGHVLNPLDNLDGTLGNLVSTESSLENIVEPNTVLVGSSDSNNHAQIHVINSTASSGQELQEGNILTLNSDGTVVNSLDNIQVYSASGLNASSQAFKRQLNVSSASSPMVTKVIITKNPNSNQPQAVPLQLHKASLQSLQPGQTLTLSSMAPGVTVVPQGVQTPTKTITFSQQAVMSPQKQFIALPVSSVSSPKPGITKIPISPAKTPTKITMIPVTVGKSPQRIAPASVLGKTLTDSYTAVPVSSGPTMITLSPSKVFKQGTVVSNSLVYLLIIIHTY